jgi:hypothetical protein
LLDVPRPKAIIAALALLLSGALLVGCSGGGSGESVDKVLDQTFNGNKKVNSGRLQVQLTAAVQGVPTLSGPLTLKVGGPFEGLEEKIKDTGQVPRANLAVGATAGGQTIKAGAVSTGSKLFVNFRGTDYVVPDRLFSQYKSRLEKAQAQSNSKQPDLESLGIHPRGWLDKPSDEGVEEVDGTKAIHVSSGVNVRTLLDDFDRLLKKVNTGQLGLNSQQRRQLPQGIPAATRKQIADAVKSAKLDLFTGKDDKILRRMEVVLDFEVPENLRQQANGLKSGKIDFVYQLADLNKAQTITEPKSAKPLSELQRQLSNAAGSLGGASSGSGSSLTTPQGGTPTSKQARRYLKCLQQARTTAESKKCASQLR